MTNGANVTREEIEALLPWYAAGTTSAEETALVEAALQSDPELRKSLAVVREDMDATILSNDALPAPSARVFERLAAGMEAHPRRMRVSTGGIIGWLGERLAALAPRQLAYAGIAAAVVVLAQAAIVGGLVLQNTDGTFQTASHGDQATRTAPGGTVVLISFVPTASVDDITRVLQRHHARIVSGPMPGGLYRVEVGSQGTGDQDQRLAGLRGEGAVVRSLIPAR